MPSRQLNWGHSVGKVAHFMASPSSGMRDDFTAVRPGHGDRRGAFEPSGRVRFVDRMFSVPNGGLQPLKWRDRWRKQAKARASSSRWKLPPHLPPRRCGIGIPGTPAVRAARSARHGAARCPCRSEVRVYRSSPRRLSHPETCGNSACNAGKWRRMTAANLSRAWPASAIRAGTLPTAKRLAVVPG